MSWEQRWICLPRRNGWVPHNWVRSQVPWLQGRIWILDTRPFSKDIQEFLINVLSVRGFGNLLHSD